MKTPEISIIIPCYNEEKNIFNTIKSISNYFNNTCFEIIVIDDGSNDNTRKIISSIDNIIMNEKKITSLLVFESGKLPKSKSVKLKGIVHIHYLLQYGIK